jgi:hypothetical protein
MDYNQNMGSDDKSDKMPTSLGCKVNDKVIQKLAFHFTDLILLMFVPCNQQNQARNYS